MKINKVSINIGVGGELDRLQKAENLIKTLVEQKPIRTYAKSTITEFNVKKYAPLGVKVTLRGKKAMEFLKNAFEAVENQIKQEQFDRDGNLSFGVKEYIEIPGMKYDPDIGMFGFDVSVNLEKSGYKISSRKRASRKIPKKHKITKQEAIKFFEENFKVKIVE